MKVLNNEEVLALNAILEDAIVKSREEDDGDPIFHEVNIKDVNPFADKRIQSVVYDNLAKRGFIQCSGNEEPSGGEELEYVCITPEGLAALKSVKGVH